jgi:hypothetical protein
MNILLLTPTHGRPLCLLLLERWIRNQTFTGTVTWCVVDSSPEPCLRYCGADVYVHQPQPGGIVSFRQNLSRLLGIAGDTHFDRAFFLEDDVYYHPEYLDTFVKQSLAGNVELYGNGETCDYNLRAGMFRYHTNTTHASLCNTGFTHSLLPTVRKAFDSFHWNSADFDLYLWAQCDESRKQVWPRTNLSVNLKCMPGEKGLIGHDVWGMQADPEYQLLKLFCGADWPVYQALVEWK